VQQHARDAHAEAADVAAHELQTGTDGCGVVTFALPLERMAYAYARLEQLPDAQRVADAMRAHPDLVGGPDGVDYELMRTTQRAVARGGAEGLLCAAIDGVGIALKSEDGASRALGPALAAFLAPLGHDLEALRTIAVRNSRGEHVADLHVAGS
jgi:L-asparaginase II